MSPAIQSNRPPTSPARRTTLRWIVVVVVSLLLHLTVIDALPRIAWQVAEPGDVEEPLRARLVPAVRADAPRETPLATAPTPAPVTAPPRAKRPPPALAPPPFVPETMDAPAEVTIPGPPEAASSSPPAVAQVAPPAPPATDAPPSASPIASPLAPPSAVVAPPPSARLDYLVLSQNIRESNPIYGVGTIDWSTDQGRYAIDLHADAKLAFFSIGVLASHSEGTIGAQGLAPDRYTESPRKRATLAVNFNRDARQSVTFSASPATAVLATGTQDRLSILFQIGGLLLGDAGQGTPGAHFDVPVAGVRGDVDAWTFESLGQEPVITSNGNVPSTHLRRVPKPGSNDRTIDLWVANEGGYPARVVYTERDGSTITMTLERVGTVR